MIFGIPDFDIPTISGLLVSCLAVFLIAYAVDSNDKDRRR